MATPARRLLPYISQNRRAVVLGLGAVIVTTAVSLLTPWILKHAIDDLVRGLTRAKLLRYSLLLISVGLVGAWFRFLMRRILIGASREMEYALRNDFFRALQRMPLPWFQRHRTGDLMSRATSDLNAVRMMIGPAVMYSANTVIVFVAAVVLMAVIDVRLTLIALMPLPFVSIAVHLFGKAIHRRSDRIQSQLADVSAVTQEALAGVRVVRAYRQEAAEVARFRRSNAELVARNISLARLQGLFFPSLTLLLGMGALLVLWFGSRAVVAERMTLGEFVAFNSYLVMLSWPMIAFGWVTNIIQRGMASWKRMLEIMESVPEITSDAADPGALASGVRGAIEVRDLTFTYPGSTRPALDGVSFLVEPGQTLAIVGGTGSGKSTLVSLIPRLLDPPAGTVLVDGADVRCVPLARLRGAVGMVTQEPFLFSDTLAANITFGQAAAPAAGAMRLQDAAAIAGLDTDVGAFPAGFDTAIGERGITLSGGQKQRTALARAIAREPAILIMDDALSAVDTDTEERILTRLRGLMRARTSIIVSHRISTVRDADLILVLAAGRVAERGTHDELVRRGGIYADMHHRQMLEHELATS
ncbi:MAG: ABC transporter ATP-binding protein/permease [Acidobacteriota bacterium]|nr:ABC transporter ATP-binding protein/permease [Acidobacteriota bacterium]